MNDNILRALDRWATEYNEKYEAKLEKQRAEELSRERAEQHTKDWLSDRRKHPQYSREETMSDNELVWFAMVNDINKNIGTAMAREEVKG